MLPVSASDFPAFAAASAAVSFERYASSAELFAFAASAFAVAAPLRASFAHRSALFTSVENCSAMSS